jgi:hypothetical protein
MGSIGLTAGTGSPNNLIEEAAFFRDEQAAPEFFEPGLFDNLLTG